MAYDFIRQAGPYKVEYAKGEFYVNGTRRPVVKILDSVQVVRDRRIVAFVGTGDAGKNNEEIVIGLTIDEFAPFRKHAEDNLARAQKARSKSQAERAHDRLYNEGGDGYNPYRAG